MKPNDVVEINKINIKVNDREIELTLDECKKLHNVLSELFKAKTEYHPPVYREISEPKTPFNPFSPSYAPSPIWYVQPDIFTNRPTLTCKSDSKTLNLSC